MKYIFKVPSRLGQANPLLIEFETDFNYQRGDYVYAHDLLEFLTEVMKLNIEDDAVNKNVDLYNYYEIDRRVITTEILRNIVIEIFLKPIP